MTEGDAATVNVDLLRIELELADAGDRLCGERFVQLDEIDVIGCQTGALESFLRRRNWTQPHATGIHSRDGSRQTPSDRFTGHRAVVRAGRHQLLRRSRVA